VGDRAGEEGKLFGVTTPLKVARPRRTIPLLLKAEASCQQRAIPARQISGKSAPPRGGGFVHNGFEASKWAMRQAKGLTLPERMVLTCLASYTSKSMVAWPSLAKLADHLETTERNIRRTVRRLEEKGFISGEAWVGHPTRYTIKGADAYVPRTPTSSGRVDPGGADESVRKPRTCTSANKRENKETSKTLVQERLEIMKWWNNEVVKADPQLRPVRGISDARFKAWNARLEEFPDLKEIVIAALPVTEFMAKYVNLTWILNPANCEKLIEGNYTDEKKARVAMDGRATEELKSIEKAREAAVKKELERWEG